MQGAGGGAGTARKKGPPFRASLAVLIGGLVLTVAAVAWLLFLVLPPFAGTEISGPGTWQVDLDRGPQLVYEQTDRPAGVTIDRGQVAVLAPDGRRIPVHNAPPSDTTDRDDKLYVAAVRFDAPTSGEYTIQLRTGPGEVFIAQPFGEALQQHIPAVVAAAVSWLVAFVGMTMLLTGVVRRGRDARAVPAPVPATGVAAPGWYPDPKGEDRYRYWDGSYWTDQTRG